MNKDAILSEVIKTIESIIMIVHTGHENESGHDYIKQKSYTHYLFLIQISNPFLEFGSNLYLIWNSDWLWF